MKKAFNFRSVIICALVLILCLTAFVACDKDKDGQNNNLANFENAKSQVYNLYKSLNNTSQTADIYLYSTLVREDGTYTITWTYTVTAGPAENISVVESDKENMIKFHVNTEATEATTVVIKGVIKDSHGNQANIAENGFTITIPKCEYASFEEYVAICKENGGSVDANSKTCAVRGFVIGVNGNGSSMGSVWIMDSKGNGYYAYKPKYQNGEDATRESLNEYLPIGTEVIVRGTPMLAFSSTLEFNRNCTIEKTGNTAEEKGVSLDYLDVTEAWGNATGITDTALEKYQARRVELKNIVMGEKSGNDFYFTVNGVEFIFRSNIYLMTNEESDALAAKWVVGGKANIKGIVNVYSSKYQVYPDSANSIEVLTQTDAEVVAGIKASLKLEESYKADFTLPTSTIATITWTVSGAGAVIGENNAVTITRADEEQTVVFTATIVKGEATDTATFTVKIPAKEVVDPNTVIINSEALDIVGKTYGDSSADGIVINGVTFKFEELCENGFGIQTRSISKSGNGKGSKIWNTTATNKAIAKLIVKFNNGKKTYDNNDTHTFTFGNEVNGNAYSTTLSTVKDQYEYEIIPDAATYTFFTFAHNASYTYSSYFESITIVYAQEKTDAEKVAEIKAGLELATTTTATDFDLPTTDVEGATITWNSDHDEIITIDGNVAKVTAPAAETDVKLTATITVGEASDTVEFTVKITVTIPEYNVTLGEVDNGTLTATVDDVDFTGGELQQNKQVVITITVNEGYEIVAVRANGTEITKGEDGKYTVTVNDTDISVTVQTRQIKYATVTVGAVENGTLDVKVDDVDVEADKQYRDGTVLTITATAEAGYKLVAIKVNGEAITGNTYTIKETDTALEITAEFAALPTSKVDGAEIKTIEELEALIPTAGNSTKERYYTMGYIKSIENTTYGNATLEDFNGKTFIIYGMYDFAGSVRYESLKDKPVAGDFVVLYGTLKNYTGKKEMENARIAQLNDTVYAPTFKQRVEEAMKDLELATEYGKDFELPATGLNGTTIEWISGNTGLVSIAAEAVDGKYVATVTVPASDENVTLTAKVKLGTYEDTKEFSITVKAASKVTLTFAASENGTFEVKAGEAVVESGAELDAFTAVTVTVTPADGYRLASYTLGEGEAVTSVKGKTTFTFDVTETTTLTVTFEVKTPEVKTITIDFSAGGYDDIVTTADASNAKDVVIDGVTYTYLNSQQNSGYLFMKSSAGYFANKTAINGTIKKIEVITTAGGSGSAVYYAEILTEAKLESQTTGKSQKGNGTLTVESTTGGSFFNVTQASNKNGQIAKIIITYEEA